MPSRYLDNDATQKHKNNTIWIGKGRAKGWWQNPQNPRRGGSGTPSVLENDGEGDDGSGLDGAENGGATGNSTGGPWDALQAETGCYGNGCMLRRRNVLVSSITL